MKAIKAFDNGGKTFDRYTIVFDDQSQFSIGPTGNHPQGVCTYLGIYLPTNDPETPLSDLPQLVKDAIERIVEIDNYAESL